MFNYSNKTITNVVVDLPEGPQGPIEVPGFHYENNCCERYYNTARDGYFKITKQMIRDAQCWVAALNTVTQQNQQQSEHQMSPSASKAYDQFDQYHL